MIGEPTDPFATPLEILPEWYFFPVFQILCTVPNKLLSVLLMVSVPAGLFGATLPIDKSLTLAYVFYKLLQTQVSNKYMSESIFHYYKTYPFIKDRIKDYFHDYFHTRGIFDSESKHKKLQNSGMSEWKNWLKSHYQYNFSHDKWSRLVPLKWR
ncbi:hypothetical protein EJ110_NYTH18620 [Nymphaea thermarum]|nr:hypothetical protein EJ110_NYTH18620 [Nymphaea thermarum]